MLAKVEGDEIDKGCTCEKNQEDLERDNCLPPRSARFRPKDAYISTYDMLHDQARTRAYREVLQLMERSATPKTSRWLDIGTGSGFLACLVAVRYWPSPLEIHACEGAGEMAEAAARTFNKNKRKNLQLFRCHSTELQVNNEQMPARATHVISEILGTGPSRIPGCETPMCVMVIRCATSGLLDEGLIPTMRDAKARLLEPGFVSVPQSAEVHAFLCESDQLSRMGRLLEGNPGVRVPSSEAWKGCPGAASPVEMHVRLPHWGCIEFRSLSPSEQVFQFDLAQPPDSRGRQQRVRFRVNEVGTVAAVVCWWRCFLDKDRSVELSTAPRVEPSEPSRDHWRQSVYILQRPLRVEPGLVVEALACHDDHAIWLDDVSHQEHARCLEANAGTQDRYACRGEPGEASVAVDCLNPGAAAAALSSIPGCPSSSLNPPACLCGLHRTFSPPRLWMINDVERTESLRLALRDTLRPGDAPEGNTRAAGGCCICVSDGFLLPLLAAQEGASTVVEMPPSATAGRVCQDVYQANDVAHIVRKFPRSIGSFYDLLSLPPGSSGALAQLGKVDAVIGEPYFVDFDSVWPMEALLLFWCVRTALEDHGCFSPRTRVFPPRARLLACPFQSDLLFRARRRLGTVEGVDLSAVNELLGVTDKGGRGDDGGEIIDGGDTHGRHVGSVESIRIDEYPHALLGRATVVLEMDLTRPLCDLSSRAEIVCDPIHGGTPAIPDGEACDGSRGRSSLPPCHGVVFWLELCLDEEGTRRLSTGPGAGYFPQGVLFFERELPVATSGSSFQLDVTLEDGSFRACVA